MAETELELIASPSFYGSIINMILKWQKETNHTKPVAWRALLDKARSSQLSTTTAPTLYFVQTSRYLFCATVTATQPALDRLQRMLRPLCAAFETRCSTDLEWQLLTEPAGSTLGSAIPTCTDAPVTIPFTVIEKYSAWQPGGWRKLNRHLVYKLPPSTHMIRIERLPTMDGKFGVYIKNSVTRMPDWTGTRDRLISRTRRLCSSESSVMPSPLFSSLVASP